MTCTISCARLWLRSLNRDSKSQGRHAAPHRCGWSTASPRMISTTPARSNFSRSSSLNRPIDRSVPWIDTRIFVSVLSLSVRISTPRLGAGYQRQFQRRGLPRPLKLLITPSGCTRAAEGPRFAACRVGRARPAGKPSAETRCTGNRAGARRRRHLAHALVWSTILSERERAAGPGHRRLRDVEGPGGLSTHEHREWVPIVENDQDMARLGASSGVLRTTGRARVSDRRTGLYTWGQSIAEAERHVEILEFLFEVVGRRRVGRLLWRS